MMDLQNALGSPLYTEVYNYELAYVQSGSPMPAQYTQLISQYIMPFIMNATIYRALDSVYARILNTSIVIKKDSINDAPVTRAELEVDKRRFLGLLDWNRDMLIRFITTQNMLYNFFPLISEFSANPDTILPDRSRAYGRTGIYLRKKKPGWYYGPGDTNNIGTSGSSSEERGSGSGSCCY
jgi:hypothetical protein